MRRVRSLILATLPAIACVFGCDPKSDMAEQPKYKPYAPNPAFADGAAARPLVAGVVPRDPLTVPGNAYVGTVALTPAGTVGTVDEAAAIPSTVDASLVTRGQQQFDIFCAACHGRLGNGLGMIAQRGMMKPPSFHVDRLKRAGDGHVYNVITAGYGAMYSYADKIPPADRWAVVAYVRALQAAGESAGGELAVTLHGSGDATSNPEKARPAGYRQ